MRQVLHDIMAACCSNLLREVAVATEWRPALRYNAFEDARKRAASQELVPARRSLHETVAVQDVRPHPPFKIAPIRICGRCRRGRQFSKYVRLSYSV